MIMLRNIPNKMDWVCHILSALDYSLTVSQLALKAILDEQCFGTYDFTYLRIDFKSACNGCRASKGLKFTCKVCFLA